MLSGVVAESSDDGGIRCVLLVLWMTSYFHITGHMARGDDDDDVGAIPQPFYGPFSGITRVSRCQKRTSGLYGAMED